MGKEDKDTSKDLEISKEKNILHVKKTPCM